MLLSHLLFLSLMCVTVNGLGEVRGTFTCRRNSEARKIPTATQAGTITTKSGTLTTKAGATIPATQAGTNTTKTGTLTTKAGATIPATQAGTNTTKTGTLTTKAGATTAATQAGTTTTKPGATTIQAKITHNNDNGTCSISSSVEGSLPNCHAIYEAGCHESGIYYIKPSSWNRDPFKVYCNMTENADENECNGGGWTVFQRRVNGSVDFNRNWTSYEDGFGELDHEFWLGNEKLHYLAKEDCKQRLRIDLVSSNGTTYHACYRNFHIKEEREKYKLHASSFRGNNNFDVFRPPGNRKFSASGMDNRNGGSMHCNALMGGWWHRPCSKGHSEINLNGDYGSLPIHNVGIVSIKSTEMKIRPE